MTMSLASQEKIDGRMEKGMEETDANILQGGSTIRPTSLCTLLDPIFLPEIV